MTEGPAGGAGHDGTRLARVTIAREFTRERHSALSLQHGGCAVLDPAVPVKNPRG